jgi:Flp pilus assembly protein TadG
MVRIRRRRGARPASRGQSLVEFALVFPIFILLLAGMIDFGIGLYSYMTIINAARDGARLAATACNSTACSPAVSARVTAAAGGLSLTGVSVVCAPNAANCSDAVKGDSVTVTAQYTYRMIWPLAFGTQIPMTSSIKFMVE